MYTYLLISFFTILIPFSLSWVKPFSFNKNFNAFFKTVIVVGIPMILWDMLFTKIGVWGFNEKYITNFHLFNLPIEEVLFFLTIPFSCIFLYEAWKLVIKKSIIHIDDKILLFFSIIFLLLGVISWAKVYTSTILILTASLVYSLRKSDFIRSNLFWAYIFSSLIGFFLVNGLLTYLPVVWYNANEITGFRIISIPIEDFFYFFFMNTIYLKAYLWLKQRHK